MNQSGHIKEATEDDNGFRQFVVNCIGVNDQRKYFSITPFGIDFNAPIDTRSLTAESRNRDESYNLGVLNKVKVDDLAIGESAIFSTLEDGTEIKSKIVLRNTGDIEITGIGVNLTIDGDVDINSTGDVNINADGNATITATQLDVNGNLTVD